LKTEKIECNILLGILIPVIATIFTIISATGLYRIPDFVVLYVTPVLRKEPDGFV